ncbi:MAG: imidazolonepropionase [Sphingobacteriaceae bacterium]|nr:imidazolonepropionase [Sphingobacteriaceae bacterium]
MAKLLTNIGCLVGVDEAGSGFKKGVQMRQLNQIEHAWLLIDGPYIAGFGPMQSLPATAASTEVVDVKGGWVFPAFCDPHTHLVFAASREGEFLDKLQGLTYEQIAARGGGILNSAARLQQMDEQELFEQSAWRLEQAAQQGIGAIEIKSGYGLTLADELKMLRVVRKLKAHSPVLVKATCLGLHAIPLEYKNNKAGYVKLVIDRLIPQVAIEGLADFVDVFCETNYFSVADMLAVMEAGEKHGLRAKLHVNQFNALGGVAAAAAHGALSVDHLEVMEEADFEALQASNTIPTVLPGCSFYLRIPYAPAREMIDRGLGVAIASDFNPGSSPSMNPELNLSLACIQQRLLPEEAVNAATINAAAAMDSLSEVGSIAIKKRANLAITRAMPSLAYLPYAFGERKVMRTMLNGAFI